MKLNLRSGSSSFCLAASLILSACSSVPMVTDIDLLTHQNKGDLMAFYQQLQGELKLAKPKSDVAENRRIYIQKVGQKIAEEKEQAIFNGLDSELDKNNISTLQAALDKGADIRNYNGDVYEDLRRQLDQAISQKKGVILSKESQYYGLGDKDALKKVELLDEIAEIYGPGAQAKQTQDQRSAYLENLLQNASEAMKTKRYEDAEMLVDNLEKIDPGHAGIEEIRHQLLAAGYEQQLWDALEKGETDKAYATFYRLTQIPDYLKTHPDVVPVAEDMAQFFIAEADQSLKKKNLSAAYQSYSRVRYIREVTNTADQYSPGEKKFIDLIDKKLERYVKYSHLVPAYGSLLILQELMPGHPAIMKYEQLLQDEIFSEAVIKVITMNFSDSTVDSAIGRPLVSKVAAMISSKQPKEIRMIDSQVAAAHYMPAQVVNLPNPASYLILSGEVLDTKITKQEQPVSETKHVLTGYVKEANPAYGEWQSLSSRKRKETIQPPITVDKPVEEDVVVNKTLIEQNGLMAVNYRLADVVSASVIYSDTINENKTFNYEDIPPVDAGLFVVKEQKAEVRSDDQVISELSDKVAEKIADKIVERVNKLQENYLKKADRSVVLEDFDTATSNYAYGYILSRMRENPDEDCLAKLKTYSLRWK